MSRVIRRNWPGFVLLTLAIGAGVWLKTTQAHAAANYYVSTSGSGTTCSLGSPCNFVTGWCGFDCSSFHPVSGDTVWIEAGDYKLTVGGNAGRVGATSSVANKTNGVTYRNFQNGKVTIDMNVDLNSASQITGGIGDFPLTTTGLNTYWGLIVYNSNTNQSRVSASFVTPTNQGQFFLMQHGSKIINCFLFDQTDGVQKNAGASGAVGTGGGNLVRGNVEQYSGFVSNQAGNERGAGHSLYVKNPDIDGEAFDRTVIDGNIGLRAFDVGTQFYSTTDQISYITMTNSIEAANGICSGAAACADPSSWPAVSCCASTYYLGTSGSVNSQTPHVTGNKDWYKGIFDSNWAIGSSTTLGGSKGVQDSIVTNNQFISLSGISMTCSAGAGFYLPFTFTGNTFYNTTLNGGGCPAPALTLANYPSNTVNAGFPGSGYLTKAWSSPDEIGRGYYAVVNWGNTANVTIDLDAMGGYAGEQYRIQNWQDLDPWDASKDVTTGTCGANCGTISVSATAPSIRQPAFTRLDGTTPFPKPADLGPRYVVFYLYPRWEAGAGTPTPTVTNTATSTSTVTNTATRTATATGAPTNTPTNTFTNLPTNTSTFTPSSTPTVTPTPSIFSTSFEAESCAITAPMRSVADTNASGGFYVDSTVSGSSVPANGGNLLCTFTIPITGVYRVWLLMMAPDSSQDSMYVSYNGEAVTSSTHIMDLGENRDCTTQEYEVLWGTASYAWRKVPDRSQNCSPLTAGPSATGWERATVVGSGVGGQLLSAGTNTLTFFGREVGARLDYVIITADMSFNPNGSGPTPTPTPGQCKKWVKCNGVAKYLSIPCSMMPQNFTRPCIWKHS